MGSPGRLQAQVNVSGTAGTADLLGWWTGIVAADLDRDGDTDYAVGNGDLPLPEKLVEVQNLMVSDDPRARKIYETVGVYLGYGVAHYADLYNLRNLLLLGRVTSGQGGQIILDQADNVLKTEFPELAERVAFHVPNEKDKRHGQAIAAASLPVIER